MNTKDNGRKWRLHSNLFHPALMEELPSYLSEFDRWMGVRPFLPLVRQQTGKQEEFDLDKGHTTLMKHDERSDITTITF